MPSEEVYKLSLNGFTNQMQLSAVSTNKLERKGKSPLSPDSGFDYSSRVQILMMFSGKETV